MKEYRTTLIYIYIPIHMDPMGNPTRPKLNCHGSSLQLNHTLEFENEEMTLTRTIPWEPTTCSSSGYIPYIGWFRSLHFWFHVFGVESGYSIFPNISPDFWLCQTPCSKGDHLGKHESSKHFITIGGGFKSFLCSPLFGEDSHFD